MKLNIRNKIWIILPILIGMVGCDESFFDINDNPSVITDPSPDLTLSAGQKNAADFLQSQYNTSSSFWVNYLTQAGNIAGQSNIDQYVITAGDNAHQNQYNGLFSNGLDDLQYTSTRSKALGDNNTFAVAELMKAYMFQVLVDLFDKVPYSEALQGLSFPTPKYDDGEDIYVDLIDKVDAALLVIDDSETIKGDIIFGGDMALWRKFGNTLKLKLLMRQSEVNGGATSSAGIATLAGAEFIGAGEDAEVVYALTPTINQHPAFTNDINVQTFIAASATIIDFMTNRSDPRVDVYYRSPVRPNDVNPHQGVPQGMSTSLTGPTAGLDYYSARNEFLIRDGSAGVFFSAAESYLLQAEAVARGWMAGNAQTLYEEGIEASFTRAGLTPAQAATYIAGSASYPNGTLAQNLNAILTEKWVSFSTRQGIEAFAEWRRTGIPDQTIIAVSPISALPPGDFALRFPFVAREQSTNPNTPAIVSLNTPVWWDN
jgi:hypothetical protein